MMSDTKNENRRKDDARPAGALTWTDPAPAAAHLGGVMIDIETMGTTPGSAILSIGAVMFGPSGLGETFYAPIALASCTAAGLTIDPDTVAWWMKQSDAARAAAFRDDAQHLAVVLARFMCWLELMEAEHPWCHGANFDAPLLEAAYRACGMTPPWKFWNVRDTRTLYELAHVKVDRARGVHHTALDDALAQAEAAVVALQRLQNLRNQAAPVLPEQVQAKPVAWLEAEPSAGGRPAHEVAWSMLYSSRIHTKCAPMTSNPVWPLYDHPAAPSAAAPAAEEVRNQALEEVVRLIDKKVEDYDREHGSYDHTTGVTEYPGDGAEWVQEMDELADEIRAMKRAASTHGGARDE